MYKNEDQVFPSSLFTSTSDFYWSYGVIEYGPDREERVEDHLYRKQKPQDVEPN